MPDPASPADSIERFAELIALEDDGYTPRVAIIAAAGVLPSAWRQIERSWMERLAAGDDAELALRFGKTYGLTRLSFSNRGAVAEVTGEGPGHASAPSDGGMQPPLDVDDTLRDMLPGVHLALDAPNAPVGQAAETLPDAGNHQAPAGYSVEPLRPPMEPADSTLVCPLDAIPKDPLPFVAVPPGKFLAFYDTKTGQRLPTPVLMDAPTSTES